MYNNYKINIFKNLVLVNINFIIIEIKIREH